MKEINISTDGSHLPKTHQGGWAALISSPDNHYERTALFGNESETTINRMEISAVLEALKAIPTPSLVTVRSDSQYVVNAISKGWLNSWVKRGWYKADGDPVKNADLWKEVYYYVNFHTVNAIWVKGHNGDLENEICDGVAKSCAYDLKYKKKRW